MKTRMIATAFVIGSILVMAASGQTNIQRKTPAEVVLQDDETGNFLLIDLTTGAYKFNVCRTQILFGGKAEVSYAGCVLTVKEVSETRLVLAEVDLCSGQGRAYLTMEGATPEPPLREYTINDKNIRDSLAECRDF